MSCRGTGIFVQGRFREARQCERFREKLYQLLTEGIPAMQKVADVYISQSIKQMQVTKLPNIRLGVSLSAGLLNLNLDVEGMDQAQLFDILSRYDRRKKYFRLKDGSFLDVSDGQLRELSALKNGLQISDRELKKRKDSGSGLSCYVSGQSAEGRRSDQGREGQCLSCVDPETCRQWKNINFRFPGSRKKSSGAIRKRAFTGSNSEA